MNILVLLVPVALLMGAAGLGAFLWSLKSGQYEDLEGAANRILLDDDIIADKEDDDADADAE
jgi:cbb3-type cytochrome oxidase maturation protein